ncbi:right-handed parallel beta-helix repeat-containing protein [Streptomyces sp. NPDC006743]|uniref:right-handed parallel beta-helix repeat-containing protein n=1 Tax=Streptomyces sp. NPDC006743 TaxID=3154480 RepID=UPI00345244BE
MSIRSLGTGLVAATLTAASALIAAPATASPVGPAPAPASAVLPAATGTVVHLDCSRTADGTGTQDAPYNSLASVNALIFGPGDTLAVASGTTCHGTLAPRGSGTAQAPVTIAPYGTGPAPVIDADGAENALHLTDQDHWSIKALELTDPAGDLAQRQGLLIESTDGRTHSGFDVDGLIVDEVAGETDKASHATAFSLSACIRTGVSGTGSLLSDVHVHDTRVGNCGGGGIKVRVGSVNTRLGRNVLVDHNTVSEVGGDGIIVSYAESPLIEYNTAARLGTGAYPWTGGNFAGIWVLGDHDATIQKNAVYGSVMSAYDSEAFDCDWGNTGRCTVQYNFSRDNAGGLFLDCDGCGTVGGATEVVRYNVSQNDCRMVGAGGGRSALRFYNNVVYCPGRKLDVSVPADSLLENNIWVGGADSRLPTGPGVSWQWNVFQGVPRPTANGIVGDPGFVAPGTGGDTLASADGYRLKATSPALRNGGVVADNGGLDYWGTPVSATAKPDRGAYDGPGL